MRHISFDESTVLNELVKIAHERGLVKEANPLMAEMKRLNAYWAKIVNAPNAQVMFKREVPKTVAQLNKKFPGNEKAIADFQAQADKIPEHTEGKADGLIQPKKAEEMSWEGVELPMDIEAPNLERATRILQDPGFTIDKFLRAIAPAMTLPGAKELLLRGVEKIKHIVDSRGAADFFSSTPPGKEILNLLGGLAPELMAMFPELKAVASTKKQNKKIAEEKKYDVTGGKGEDLINDAHPGGGTKTELDSKTDENLVETIVEQQKKDLEVAHSVPKGVLAKLIEIANSLDKKGFVDEASEVDSIISKIAAEVEDLKKKSQINQLEGKLQKLKQDFEYVNTNSSALKQLATDVQSKMSDRGFIDWLTNSGVPNDQIGTLTQKIGQIAKQPLTMAVRQLSSLTGPIKQIINQYMPNLNRDLNLLGSYRKEMMTVEQQLTQLKSTQQEPAQEEQKGIADQNVNKKKQFLEQARTRLQQMLPSFPKDKYGTWDKDTRDAIKKDFPGVWEKWVEGGDKKISSLVKLIGEAQKGAVTKTEKPATIEDIAIQKLKAKFPRLEPRYVPELVSALKNKASELQKYHANTFTEEKAKEMAAEGLQKIIDSIGPEDLKKYMVGVGK